MEIQPYTESTPESLTATLRNWLIGCYIVEYEQGGRDRAKYGDRLLNTISATLSQELDKEDQISATPSPVWTTNSLSLLICSSCQTRVRSKSSC
jgi:hypothetical protein